MVTTKAQKQHAIEIHSLQAGEFATSYDRLNTAVYAACFTYSRRRLDAWLDRYLPRTGAGLSLLDVGWDRSSHGAIAASRFPGGRHGWVRGYAPARPSQQPGR